jgi:hypothetical protein
MGGIIHSRPYDDPRNTVVVDNSDPKAYNRLYVGIPGTHLEQRCCGDKPPYREAQRTGWYADSDGNRICKVTEYWSRPENRDGARNGWWNAETPPGYQEEWAATGMLMCGSCDDRDSWDEFVEGLEFALQELMPVIEGIAIVASYFPVIGTAISFLLETAVSLAKGQSLDEAALDGLGNSLPGQPATGAAYRVVKTTISNGSIDEIAISALPITEEARTAIRASVRICVAVAEGEELTDAVLREVYEALPEAGRRGFDVARRIIDGEDVQDIVISEATKAAAELAKSQGEAAVNRFIAESAFQSVVETSDPILQTAIRWGIVAGHVVAVPFVGEFDFSEKDVLRNDHLAAKGEQVITSGATWRGRKLSEIRSGRSFSYTRKELDPLSHTEQIRTHVDDITEQWRRGFNVAIGLCEGVAEDNLEQNEVRLSLGSPNMQKGFDAGQYIQHNRTIGEWHQFLVQDLDDVRVDDLKAIAAQLEWRQPFEAAVDVNAAREAHHFDRFIRKGPH